MKKVWQKCYRCKEEYEKLYLVPYVTKAFIDITICRECSMSYHKKIAQFTNKFLEERDPVSVYSEYGGDAICLTSDGRNVNVAEEMNTLETAISPLSDGKDPPAGKINPDYKQQPTKRNWKCV